MPPSGTDYDHTFVPDENSSGTLQLAELVSLVAMPDGEAVCMSLDGEISRMSLGAPLPPAALLVCHTPLTARRLRQDQLFALDVLELFAFAKPATFAAPTISGLCEALGFEKPPSPLAEAQALWQIRDSLLNTLADLPPKTREEAAAIAFQMGKGGWRWSDDVLAALDVVPDMARAAFSALSVWTALPEWEEGEPPAWSSPDHTPTGITSAEARTHLASILEASNGHEPRPQQSDYTSAISTAFTNTGSFVLAEAGTGTGKTLGYLAPAHLWSQKNHAPVWISTYTRNLQRQLETETKRLYPSAREHRKAVVIRKGRENYLCLLNFEEALRGSFARPGSLIALGLIARWISATHDGDIRGGDLPGWLAELIGGNRITFLADKRGECMHGACPHYKRCFIEHSVREARQADIVIANHALVMNAAAKGGVDEAFPPSRFIFDEGHHLFDAADNAFGVDLTGRTLSDLRKWLLGGEGKSSGRIRGLSKRMESITTSDGEETLKILDEIRTASMVLPADTWRERLKGGQPRGHSEVFLNAVQQLVLARDPESGETGYSLECALADLPADFLNEADTLRVHLVALADLIRRLRTLLTDETEEEKTDGKTETLSRKHLLANTLNTYVLEQLNGWTAVLKELHTGTPDLFVDWASLERYDGALIDVGLCRRHIDPTLPFVQTLGRQAASLVATSATLTDPGSDDEEGWATAEAETGAVHSPLPIFRARVPSPFDYVAQSRLLVVNDLPRGDIPRLAEAYRELFFAAGGGGLGLFTAIERLKQVHRLIHHPISAAGHQLYSQHVDGLDPQTLIDMFRADGNAFLLGTDAVRDGVDIPGDALRLLVFDKIPWPRSSLLMSARKAALGGSAYTERLTRQKLRQAYGRLIRRATDKGVFVILSPLPRPLKTAFAGVHAEWVSLAEAVDICRTFLGKTEATPENAGRTEEKAESLVKDC